MIFITGDTHAHIDIRKLGSKTFSKGENLTKNDYVIILGDFGLVWKDDDATEKYWLKWLENKKWTTLFIDGNHENHEKIRALPEVEMFGSKVGKVNDSVYHLRRGNIYTIDGKTFLTIGGAESIDKMYRTEWVTWWKDELLSGVDIYNALDNLATHKHTVDYILTHTCPISIFNLLGYSDKGNDPTMRQLEAITNDVTYKHWYFAHFHQDFQISGKFTCVYDEIIKLKD